MEEQKSEQKDNRNLKGKEYTVLDYVKIFLRHKKSIILITLFAIAVSIFVAFFVLDHIYYSAGTIKSTSETTGLGGLIGMSNLPGLDEFSGLTGGSVVKELALYETILLSRRCVEETIIKFNIMEEKDIEYMFFATKYFREEVMNFETDKIAGTMEIGVFDKDPVRAKDMADFLIYQLNKINTELKVQSARNNREFIESRLNLVKKDLKAAEDSLKMYQDIYGIAPDLTVQVAVKTEIELEVEIKSEEVKLDLLRKILSPDQAEIKAQEETIASLKKQLLEIQNSPDRTSKLNLKGSPDIVMNYLRLKRDVEIQNSILIFVIPLYEQAKIEENKETPAILILDVPNVPDYKTKPKRLTIIVISTFLVFIIVYSFFIVRDKWKYYKSISS